MKKIIIFNIFRKKLLLPFGVAFLQILINIMNAVINENPKNQLLEMIDTAFSEMAIALIPIFNIYTFTTATPFFMRRKIRKKIRDYSILVVIFVVYIFLYIYRTQLMTAFYQQNKSLTNPHNSDLSSFESIELIFITIVSHFLLKYKYFIHHNISILIFIFISFFIDLILDNFPDLFSRGFLYILISFIIVIIDAGDYGYQKYMMDVQFHPYWAVSLTLGIVNFIIFGSLIIACLHKGKEESFKEKNAMFMSFFAYFDSVSVGTIIVKHILNFILNFVLNLLRSLTILYFTPDYILISFTISRIINIVVERKAYVCLVLFVLQFITLMFYLEIFELNFCGLNKNTKRNIAAREQKEMLLQEDYENHPDTVSRSSTFSEIDISPGYFIYNKETNPSTDISSPKNGVIEHTYELNDKFE